MSHTENIVVLCSANLGDALSKVFYAKLSQKPLKQVGRACDDLAYLTVGSVLRQCKKNHIIMGTGFISDNDDLGKGDWRGPWNSKVFQKPKEILSVRGPKTRKKLLSMGIECPEIYGDPLLAYPLVYDKKIDIEYDIGIIPHYIDRKTQTYLSLKEKLSKDCKVNYINIMSGGRPEHFVNELKKCEYIISSTLHGVMFSLAYGRKTIFTEFSNQVIGKGFKFFDFFESLGVNYNVLSFDNDRLLDNEIKIDKENLNKVGAEIVNVCPFIEPQRKAILIKNWDKHVDLI